MPEIAQRIRRFRQRARQTARTQVWRETFGRTRSIASRILEKQNWLQMSQVFFLSAHSSFAGFCLPRILQEPLAEAPDLQWIRSSTRPELAGSYLRGDRFTVRS